MTGSYLSRSPAETEAIANKLGMQLKSGDIVAFRGGLGAGKTAFVRGLALGLGIQADVSSPTFTLVQEYASPGSPTLYHFDMYRITHPDSLESTGFYDYLDQGGILAIEWSEQIAYALPEDVITVTITPTGETIREITITGGRQP